MRANPLVNGLSILVVAAICAICGCTVQPGDTTISGRDEPDDGSVPPVCIRGLLPVATCAVPDTRADCAAQPEFTLQHFDVGEHGATGIAIQEVTGDCVPDLVVAEPFSRASVNILPGNEQLLIGAPVDYDAPRGASHLAVGDFDRDGWMDVAITGELADQVVVLFNDEFGCPITPTTIVLSTADQPRGLALGDLDNDEDMDIVVAHRGNQSVGVFLGGAGRSFGQELVIPVAGHPSYVSIAHFNGDECLDIAVAHSGGGPESGVLVLLGRCDGTFDQGMDHPVGNQVPGRVNVTLTGLVADDFNSDGFADVAVIDRSQSNAFVLAGDGFGVLTVSEPIPVGSHPEGIIMGDFNHDGLEDLAVAAKDDRLISILQNEGEGSFSRTDFNTGFAPLQLAVGDVDRDGDLDVAIGQNSGKQVTLMLNRCGE